MLYKIEEDYPGDRKKYGVDIAVIGENEYEFMARCDLWRHEVTKALEPLKATDKIKIKYRTGATGYWQVKTLRR